MTEDPKQLTPDGTTKGSARARTKSRTSSHRRFVLPPMRLKAPSGISNTRAKQFFGYAIDSQWIVDLAKSWDPEVPDNVETCAFLLLVALRKDTRIDLTYECGILEDDSLCVKTSRIGSDGRKEVSVLSICSTRSKSFARRPSQKQVDWLTKLLGQQPRWWKEFDTWPREDQRVIGPTSSGSTA